MALAALDNEATFPLGSLSEAIVISEDVQGYARRKMFSLIGSALNATDKTVLWKHQVKDLILKKRNLAFTKGNDLASDI